LAAAIQPNDLGAVVAIVEKLVRPDGNTAISTGSIPGAGTRCQRAAGISGREDGVGIPLAADSCMPLGSAGSLHRPL